MDSKLTTSFKQTQDLASNFAKTLKKGDVVLLFGNLGAGKTTFVQGLAKGLGIKERILSPTFIIHRLHDVENSNVKTFNHVDLYRLENQFEIEALGLGEIAGGKDSVTIIEWAERLRNFSPKQGYRIWFTNLGGDKRKIRIEKI